MKRTLYKTALISAPIIALYGSAPMFAIMEGKGTTFFERGGLLTVITLVIWAINLFIIIVIDKKEKLSNIQRYALSFSIVLIFTSFALFIGAFFEYHRVKPPFIFPFLISFANNAIILIIINSIILQYKKNQADNEIAQLKISNMKAQHHGLIQQIQPHFLFNSLSTLKSLIKSNTDLAEDYLIKLSDFLRYTIYSNTNKLVKLQDELEFTLDYIELQQIRFSNAIQFEFDIPETAIKQFQIPIYALQSLAENAIKHNEFSPKKPLYLTIEFENDSLIISNNKIPKPLIIPAGIGLQNLNERYKLACNKSIEITDTETYFTVKIKLI